MRERALDQARFAAFTNSNAAFLGSIACQLDFEWNDKLTNSCEVDLAKRKFYLNEDWFMRLTKVERQSVILHGLWHVARMHAIRQGTRETKDWIKACNLRINADLRKDGYKLPEDSAYDPEYVDQDYSEEQIYEEIYELSEENKDHNQGWGNQSFDSGDGDSNGGSEDARQNNIAIVQTAMQTAKAAGQWAGEGSSSVEQILDSFLRPKLPWRTILNNYLTDTLEDRYTWSRPNRRFQDMYLPSITEDDGRLEHVVMFLDVSGSITEEQIKEFNSEVKFIKEELLPKKLTVVQFDTEIVKEQVFTEDMPFKKVVVVSGGGTSYRPVHDWILKNKPNISIIFTDLYCNLMEPVGKYGDNLFWIVNSNEQNRHKFGRTIYIPSS